MASSTKKNNKVGSICCDNIEYVNNTYFKSGLPDEIIKEFLQKLTEQFAVEAARRMYIIEQASPLLCRDQLLVILTQALSMVTNTFLVKPKFESKPELVSRKVYNGLDSKVDFWIVYEGIIILLNFSNEVSSTTSSRLGKKIKSSWTELYKNLDKVIYPGSFKSTTDYRVYKVTLNIITFSRKVNNTDANVSGNSLSGWRDKLLKELNPRPDWSGCWELSTLLAGPYEYANIIELYPAVAFVAHIEAIYDESQVYTGKQFDCLAVVKDRKLKNRVGGDIVYWAYQKVCIEKPEVASTW